MLERTFAEALGAGVGDVVTLNGQRFTVAGIAVTAAQAPYPNLCYFTASSCPPWLTVPGGDWRNVGVIWMTKAGTLGLTSKANPLTTTYMLNLKLSNPADADAFAQQRFVPPPQPSGSSGFTPPYLGPMYSTWDGIASADALLVQDAQSVLEPGALLLTLLAIASVTVLVGRRLSEYARRVGLLKAVGGTPGTVAAMFLTENLVLALLAAAVGLVAGSLAAPLLTNPGAALVGAPGAPSLTAVTAIEVIGVALAVALAATLVPAIRAAHTSTVAAINDVVRPPRRRGALIRISPAFPSRCCSGSGSSATGRAARCSARRTSRFGHRHRGGALVPRHRQQQARHRASLTAGGLFDPVVVRDEQMLTVITIMLVVLAALNAIFTTWATVIDARRASALMRALGARASQVSSGLSSLRCSRRCQAPSWASRLASGSSTPRSRTAACHPRPGSPGAVLGALLVIAALTVVPAWVGTRQPAAEVLQAEAA